MRACRSSCAPTEIAAGCSVSTKLDPGNSSQSPPNLLAVVRVTQQRLFSRTLLWRYTAAPFRRHHVEAKTADESESGRRLRALEVWHNARGGQFHLREALLALFQMHTIRCTPAMAAGVVDRLWSMDDLYAAVTEHAAKARVRPSGSAGFND
jgi:hypothetical protein